MAKLKIKVCGMKYPKNIQEVAESYPDYMGFIFYRESPRYIGTSADQFLFESLPEDIKKVGVFVNENILSLKEVASANGLEYVQLHGRESVDYCTEIRNESLKLMKVVSIGSPDDMLITKKYKDVVDFFLFDTKGKYFGGNGRKFDWDILNTYELDIPYFLSGGIELGDIDEILSKKDSRMHAIDINSGFEIEPGLKNEKWVKKAIEKIRKQ